jgi:S1-C subfamily serine protease
MKIIMIQSDSPPEKAGSKVKDVILEIAGKHVPTINGYNQAIGADPNIENLKLAGIENQIENFLVIEV